MSAIEQRCRERPGGMSAVEQRRRERAPYKGWVELTVDGRRLRVEGRDLSADGIGVALPVPPPDVACSLVSEFALPGIALPVELRGYVVWSDAGSGRAGVRFEGIDPGLAELLSNFVAGRL